MDKEISRCMQVCTHARTHAHTQRNILFNHKKGENPTIFNNTDGPRRHYALISLICVTPPLKKKKKQKTCTKLTGKKISFVVTRWVERGQTERMWSKGTILQF